jgi:hypothetical protein
MKYKHSIILAAVMSFSMSAFGWGQKGHDVTVYIAECNMTEVTRLAVDSLFDCHSPVYYANWLDNASHTPEYAYSKTWHYKNIDADETYESAHTIETGNIITALRSQADKLKDNSLCKSEKSLALKMLIHLMGDLHQPMHFGHFSDRGGNEWKVKFFNKETNLHSVWDDELPESVHRWSYTEWRNQLDIIDDAELKGSILAGEFDDWGKETYELGKNVYETTPKGSCISYDYIANNADIVEKQLLRGGLRLAHVLNQIFDKNYITSNSKY